MDELSQLDELIESDILEALGQNTSENTENKDEINIEDFDDQSALIEDEIKIEDLEDQSISPEDEINIEDLDDQSVQIEDLEQIDNIPSQSTDTTQKIEANINTTDLGSLLSQLLTNKTIEITIKIKD